MTRYASVELPAELVRHVLGLLGIAESLVATAVARAEREGASDAQLLTSLEEIIAHLADGHDSRRLIHMLQTAQRDIDTVLAN